MSPNCKDPATVIDGAGPGIACLAASGPENSPSVLKAQASAPDPIEAAIRSGAVRALRNRAAVQRQRAADSSIATGDQACGVTLRSPEAALALRLAAELEGIAAEIEAEGST